MIIAIDGPAASGKGTLGKRLAAHYGLRHLDTGLLYRAVAKALLDAGQQPGDEASAIAAAKAIDPARFDEVALKGYEVAEAASVVSALGGVRAALFDFQREIAAKPPGAVLDGRDIGTVIAPNATAKLFVTASPEIRAERRYLERKARGEPTSYEAVLNEIRRRDERDEQRSQAPMRSAIDAFLLDTSNLDIEAAFNTAVGVISRKVGQRGRT